MKQKALVVIHGQHNKLKIYKIDNVSDEDLEILREAHGEEFASPLSDDRDRCQRSFEYLMFDSLSSYFDDGPDLDRPKFPTIYDSRESQGHITGIDLTGDIFRSPVEMIIVHYTDY